MNRLITAFVALASAGLLLGEETNQLGRAEAIFLKPRAKSGGLGVATNDVDREFRRLLAEDDTAQADAERLAQEAARPLDPVTAPSPEAVKNQIADRMKSVRSDYEDFLRRHPDHAKAHLAFGSFLNERGDEDGAITEGETARRLDPTDAAAWNNLAGVYAHHGPVTKSFPYYEEAIRLNPKEPSYYHSFGTLVFLFRHDATNYFRCNETEVFNKALALYRRGLELQPDDFNLAADYAQTFYGIRPAHELGPVEYRMAELKLGDQALAAWTNAMRLAEDEEDRQGVQLHYARWNIKLARFDAARTNLSSVTLDTHAQVKERLTRSLAKSEGDATPAKGVAGTPASPNTPEPDKPAPKPVETAPPQ